MFPYFVSNGPFTDALDAKMVSLRGTIALCTFAGTEQSKGTAQGGHRQITSVS